MSNQIENLIIALILSAQNMDYVVVSGASRKNEKWEHVEGETMAVQGKSEAEKLATDPMYGARGQEEGRGGCSSPGQADHECGHMTIT